MAEVGSIRLRARERHDGPVFRRSLSVVQEMDAGEAFTTETARIIRPGYGLPPNAIDEVIGRRATRPIARGTRLSWDLVDRAR